MSSEATGDVRFDLLSLSESVGVSATTEPKPGPAGSPESPSGAAGVSHDASAASLTASLPPLSQAPLNVPSLPPAYLDVCLQEVTAELHGAAGDPDGPSNTAALQVPVSRAVLLTRGGPVKKSLLLELDVSVGLRNDVHLDSVLQVNPVFLSVRLSRRWSTSPGIPSTCSVRTRPLRWRTCSSDWAFRTRGTITSVFL